MSPPPLLPSWQLVVVCIAIAGGVVMLARFFAAHGGIGG